MTTQWKTVECAALNGGMITVAADIYKKRPSESDERTKSWEQRYFFAESQAESERYLLIGNKEYRHKQRIELIYGGQIYE